VRHRARTGFYDARRRLVRAVIATVACWMSAVAPAVAQKTDVVELANGDRITCEIQKLDRGKLSVKTDGIGTISIEWDDVERVTSAASYDLELVSGIRIAGSIARGDARTMQLVTATGPEPVALSTVVRMNRLGRTFWRRLDGSVAAGFNFTQADLQTQWTFNGDVSYRSRKWLLSLSADSLLTTREDVDSQSRNDLNLQAQRFMRPRWSYVGLGIFQQNEELSLDLRSVVGGGFVRTLKQSPRTLVDAQFGVAFTNERYTGSGDQSVAEAVSGLNWDFYTFDGRSMNIGFGVMTFVALESDSRLRLELKASFKSDIVGDLYWSVNTFESYNSDPPAGQKKSDAGVSATLGWTF
jgi:putative salt-induced outer membrane protein YdiY